MVPMVLAMVVTAGAASSPASGVAEGLYFSHKDWELVCDNTRTCRALAYQAGEDEGPGERCGRGARRFLERAVLCRKCFVRSGASSGKPESKSPLDAAASDGL
jgi:hypothetical protein